MHGCVCACKLYLLNPIFLSLIRHRSPPPPPFLTRAWDKSDKQEVRRPGTSWLPSIGPLASQRSNGYGRGERDHFLCHLDSPTQSPPRLRGCIVPAQHVSCHLTRRPNEKKQKQMPGGPPHAYEEPAGARTRLSPSRGATHPEFALPSPRCRDFCRRRPFNRQEDQEIFLFERELDRADGEDLNAEARLAQGRVFRLPS